MKEDLEDRIEDKYTKYLNCETDDLDLTIEESIFILENDEKEHFVDDLLHKAYEVILSAYKRVLEENKDLKRKERNKCIGEYGKIEIHDLINKTLTNDYIPKSKVKEKIEELDKRIDYLNTELTKCYIERERLGTERDIDKNETYIYYIEQEKDYRQKQKEILKELLEEGE